MTAVAALQAKVAMPFFGDGRSVMYHEQFAPPYAKAPAPRPVTSQLDIIRGQAKDNEFARAGLSHLPTADPLPGHKLLSPAEVQAARATLPMMPPRKVAMPTDTPALDALAQKTAGLGDAARNALMATAIGSAGLTGGMGGHHLVASHQQPVAVVPSAMPGRADVTVGGRPSDYRGYQPGAAHEIAGNMQDAQSVQRVLGGAAGGGAAGSLAALALLAARRQRPQLGARPVQ